MEGALRTGAIFGLAEAVLASSSAVWFSSVALVSLPTSVVADGLRGLLRLGSTAGDVKELMKHLETKMFAYSVRQILLHSASTGLRNS